MLAVERRKQIVSLINEKKSLVVQELGRMYGVTEETVRRDLEMLEKQGILVRTYGGAVLPDDTGAEISVDIREEINVPGKDAIGREAAKMVADGDVIILDASTSAMYVARHIKGKKALTVITNAEKVVLELAGCEDITVISTGGVLRHRSLSYVGRAAENVLSGYYANKVFFSCKGITPNRGMMDSNEQEAELRRAMIKCSESAVLLCDSTKFGKVGFVHTADFEDIDFMITDSALPDGWKEQIASNGMDIRIAYP